MTCPTLLTCSLHADGALSGAEGAELDRHLAGCWTCRQRVDAARADRAAIGAALRAAETVRAIPAFTPPPTAATLLIWLGWMAVAAWAVDVAWSSIAALELPQWLAWLAPNALGAGIDLLIGLVLDALSGGIDTMPGITAVALYVAATATALAIAARLWQQPSAAGPLSLCLLVVAATAAPSGHAFEVRHDETRVVVDAGETIDDTLVVMAENVQVDGTVTGDLIAMGRRVTVTGKVGGVLVAAGQTLVVEGRVTGTALTLGETLELRDADLGANAYAAGRSVVVDAGSRVAGNAALAGESVDLHGRVGRDLLGAAERLTVYGSVDGNLRAISDRLDLTRSARIGGDVQARLADTDNLSVAPGAEIGGETRVDTLPTRPSRYASPGYYLSELLHFVAAFVSGLVLMHFFPGLFQIRPETGSELLTAAGVGAVVLLATPVLAAAAIMTLIGAPLGLLVLAAWIGGLYVSGIVTSVLIGRRLLAGRESRSALILLAGLLVLFVLINVPVAGGAVRLLAMLLGLGVVALAARRWWQRSDADPAV